MFCPAVGSSFRLSCASLALASAAVAADFTWTGAAGDGKWSSSGNWSSETGGIPADKDQAYFAEGTAADIQFDRAVSFGTLCISNRNLRLAFTAGEGVAVTCAALVAGDWSRGPDISASFDSRVIFDGVKLTVTDRQDVRINSGIDICLTGASALDIQSVRLASEERLPYPQTILSVEADSRLTVRDTLNLSGDGTLSISNATVAASKVIVNGFGTGYGGGRVVFRGKSPRLEVAQELHGDTSTGYNLRRFGADFDFHVPSGGYAEAPISYAGTMAFLNAPNALSACRFNVCGDSPVFAGADYGSWPLVTCTQAEIATAWLETETGRSYRAEEVVVSATAPGEIRYVRHDPAGVLQVTADPYEVGTGGYGFRRGLSNGESLTLTAPTPPEGSGLSVAGYRLFDLAADGTAQEVAGSPFEGTSCAYVHGTSGRRLTWLWRQPEVYVSPDGDDAHNGTSAAAPLRSVQAGIDRYAYGKVLLSPGTYELTNAVTVTGGVTVIGTGERPSEVVLRLGRTVFTNVLVLASETAQVRNVRITNKGADGNDGNGRSGVLIMGGLLAGCEVVDCMTKNLTGHGGGVYLSGGVVRDCVISNNCARGSGAGSSNGNGVFMSGGLVENCRILDNDPTLKNAGGGQDGGGGGVYLTGGVLRGCLVRGNAHPNQASGIFACGGTVENCTIVGNGQVLKPVDIAGVFIGGTRPSQAGSWAMNPTRTVFRNNIVRDNFNQSGEANLAGSFHGYPTSNSTSSVLDGGTGNIDCNPFLDSNSEPGFSLCIDAGTWVPWMDGATDLAGRPRVLGGAPDMGAFERPASATFTCAFSVTSDGAADEARVSLKALVEGGSTAVTSCRWTFTNGDGQESGFSFASADAQTVTLPAGVYGVSLRVENAAGEVAEASQANALTVFTSVAWLNPSGRGTEPYATRETGAAEATAIARAVRLVAPGGTIRVADGRYLVASTLNLQSGMRLVSENGPSRAVIQADAVDAFTKQVLPLVILKDKARVEGLTFVGGAAGAYNAGAGYQTGDAFHVEGGGVVSNCVVRDLFGTWAFDMHAIQLTDGTVVDTAIENVTAGVSGGSYKHGLAISMTGGLVDRVRITGVSLVGSTSMVWEHVWGSALLAKGGTVRNTLVTGCASVRSSAVALLEKSVMESCTVVSNVNSETKFDEKLPCYAGGIYLADNATLLNSVVADNWSALGNCVSNLCGTGHVSYTLVNGDAGVAPGEGNLVGEPRFRRPVRSGRPTCASPAVGAGLWQPWMADALDLLGRPRAPNGKTSLGCYEEPFPGGLFILR